MDYAISKASAIAFAHPTVGAMFLMQ